MLSESFISNVLERLEKLSHRQTSNFVLDLVSDRTMIYSLLELIQEGVMVLDSDRRIEFVTRRALKPFGLALTGVTGQNLADVLPSEIRDVTLDAFGSADMEGVSLELSEPFNRRLTVQRLARTDRLVNSDVYVISDQTAQMRDQERLEVLEEQATLNRIAAGIAHEIKNPLSALSIHVELLARYADDISELRRERFNSNLSVVSEEIQRLNRIVQDFLFTARPLHLQRRPVDVSVLISSLAELLQPDFDANDVHLDIELTEDNSVISADDNLLKTALINIMKNAREASGAGDHVRVKTEVTSDNAHVRITLRDEGVGIPREALTRIFEPYFTTKQFGTGLGLTMTYKIIREHDGQIRVDSAEQTGTTFIITLPRAGRDTRPIANRSPS